MKKTNLSKWLVALSLTWSATALADSDVTELANGDIVYSAQWNNVIPAGTKLAKVQFLTRNAKENPATIDPGKLSDSNSINVARSLFDTLVRQAPDGRYVGVAAQSWVQSADGLTWTFNLRKNAKWSDGKPVTAHDFVYAWQRLVDPQNGSVYIDYLANANVKNAAQISAGQLAPSALGVEAKDDYTFVVHLSQVTPWFTQLVTLGVLAPVREDKIKQYGDQWTHPQNFVGNGPYVLTENIINGHITFVKNPDYWDAKNVLIEKSQYIFMTDINMIYNKYLANEVLTADIPPSIYNKVLEERPDEVKEYIDPLTWALYFNVNEVPDVRVRQAIKLLIDNRYLTNVILKAGQPTSIFTPTFLADGQLATEEAYFSRPYEENVEQAIALLKEAGYTASKPFSFKIVAPREQLMNVTLVAIQGWLQQKSQGLVKMEATITERKVYEDIVQNKNYQVRLGWTRGDYDQASAFYNTLLCNNGQNSTAWCSAEYDSLVNQANNTVDPEKRAQLYSQANKVIQEQTPVAPIYLKGAYLLKSPALGGLSLKVKRRFLRDYYIIDAQVAPTKK
ncbi:peptide ABC transporter substrate-binding protein [Psittacicella melopsittaci]|uniref:peptide ABC transporter substrate-binding protein n=1 Tax=Psittacicella melopsittaci TaxID=2028576 RepID=UPI001CA61D23|nr:peptide ABC transporter substrate-binding protein [Psittacicella melopsittaci]